MIADDAFYTSHARTIDWVPGPDGSLASGHIQLIDQTLLPGQTVLLDITDVPTLIDAICRLSVRGAPALGVAGAMGVALAALDSPEQLAAEQIAALRHARPTAVNLALGVDIAAAALTTGGPEAALQAALKVRDDDIAACEQMAERAVTLLTELTGGKPRLTIMTICNTGALAAVEHGTALGVIELLHQRGQLELAIPLETRPLLQGARLTAWELTRMGAPFRLIVDSAAASILARGGIDAVLIGADRIAANGDSANKIGSFALSLAARHAGVPFLVIAPETTIDRDTARGAAIEIEDRGSAEVANFHGVRTAPEGTQAINPAFDVTPAELITAIVTNARVIRPDHGQQPADPM